MKYILVGLGSGHEALSFEYMDIFDSQGCPKIVAFDNDSEELVDHNYFVPYYHSIINRDLKNKIPVKQSINPDGSKREFFLYYSILFLDMEKDTLTGLMMNRDVYAGMLVIR